MTCHVKEMARDSFLKIAAPLIATTFVGVYALNPLTQEQEAALTAEAQRVQQVEQSVNYAGCNEVRALGKAPLYRGSPGYGEHMDGDNDGIACEPYR
jgi:hypothetical protein